ncbi:hypothetical protein ACFL3T_04245 [Patescibacteria group bacterium]
MSSNSTPEAFQVHSEVKAELQPVVEASMQHYPGRPMLDRYVGYAMSACGLDNPNVNSTVSEKGVLACLDMVKPVTPEDEALVKEAVGIIWDYVRVNTEQLGLME